MIKNIDFWPRIVAENYNFSDEHIVISITDPGQKLAVIKDPDEVLRIAFYDLPGEVGDSRFDNGLFTEDHAKEIIKFLDKYHNLPKEKKLIVHCEAGVCRSASVALFAHTYTKADFKNIDNTYAANILVTGICSNVSGVDVIIPEPKKSKGGILLF